MSDLKSMLTATAEQQQPQVVPPFDGLVARYHRRRRARVAGGVMASAVIAGTLAGFLLSHDPSSRKDHVGITSATPACSARDLGGTNAQWIVDGLVLQGRLLVRNMSAAPCRL